MSISVKQHGPVTVIAIDRPAHRNAVDRAAAEALVRAFAAFDTDDDALVAVLTGGGGTFCAGADLKAIAAGSPNRVAPDGDGPMGPTRMRLSKPVIAAIEGHAVAGGLELALWCDLRVAANDAVFGVFCRRFGVPLIDGGTIRLPRLVGMGRALDMILTGRAVGAQEALAIGLATRVVPSGHALREAIELSRGIASMPQAAMRGDRASAYEQWGLPIDEAMRNELRHGAPALATQGIDGAARFAAGAGRHGDFEGSACASDPTGSPSG